MSSHHSSRHSSSSHHSRRRERSRSRERSRERSKSRERSRERSRSRERESKRDSHKERDTQRDRESTYREKESNRESSNRESRNYSKRDDRESQGGSTTQKRDNRQQQQYNDKGTGRRDNYNSHSNKEDHAGDHHGQEEGVQESRSLLLKGLKSITTEDQILDHLKVFGPVESVKLMRDKVTGESRGFAFVDFPTIEDAQSVLNYTNYSLVIDGCNIHLDYSRGPQPKHQASVAPQQSDAKDWICTQVLSGIYGSLIPHSVTLPILQGEEIALCVKLKRLITQQLPSQKNLFPRSLFEDWTITLQSKQYNLWSVFSSMAQTKDVRLIKDKHTHASRGFAFVEFFQVEDATRMIQQHNPLMIEGRAAKLAYSSTKSAKPEVLLEGPQLLAKQYFDRTYTWGAQQGTATDMPVPALQQIDPVELINSKDLTLFAYDTTSGHYYHSATGLYYYPQTDKYWDSFNGTYYLFDKTKQQYFAQEKPKKDDGVTKKDTKTKEKKSAPIQVKKVNQFIQKWSEKKKELHEVDLQQEPPKQPTPPQIHTEATPEEAHDTPNQEANQSILKVAPVSGEAPELQDVVIEESQITVGLVCLLCKRQFNSNEVLHKHISMSELHKQNLEIAKQKQLQRMQDAALRAMEEEEEANWKRWEQKQQKQKYNKPADEEGDLNSNNVGSKLLSKMGWKKGEGIGRQGVVTAPIEVELRNDRSGVGMHSSENPSTASKPGDTFYDWAKKRTRARFDQMLETEYGSKRGKV